MLTALVISGLVVALIGLLVRLRQRTKQRDGAYRDYRILERRALVFHEVIKLSYGLRDRKLLGHEFDSVILHPGQYLKNTATEDLPYLSLRLADFQVDVRVDVDRWLYRCHATTIGRKGPSAEIVRLSVPIEGENPFGKLWGQLNEEVEGWISDQNQYAQDRRELLRTSQYGGKS